MVDKLLDAAFQDLGKSEEPFAPVVEEQAPVDASVSTPDIVGLTRDPMFKAMSDLQLRSDQQTATALDGIKTQNPDLYARASKIADLQEVPADVVYRNIEDFEGRDKLAVARAVLETNPAIADWFAQGDNARVVDAPDLDRLSGLSFLARAIPAAYSSGSRNTSSSTLAFKEMFGQATDDEQDQLARLQATAPEYNRDKLGMAATGFLGAVEQLPILKQMITTSLEVGALGAVGGAGLALAGGQLGPQAALPEEAVTVPVAAIAGGGAGAKIGATFESFRLNSGEAYLDYKQFRDKDGQLMDANAVRGAAIISGAISAGLDVAGLSAIVKTLPGAGDIAKLGSKKAVKELLKQEGFREIAKKVGARFAEGVAVETFTEMAQELTKIVTGEAFKAVSSQQFEYVAPGDAAQQVLEVGRQTLLATLFLAGATSSTSLAYDAARANKAPATADTVARMAAYAQDDKLAVRDPDRAADAVQTAFEGSGKETVFIPLEKLVSLLQSEDKAKALLNVKGIQKAVTEAVSTGSPVAIPVGEFYAKLLTYKGFETLAEDVTFEISGMSLKEARDVNEQVAALKEKWASGEAALDSTIDGPIYKDIYKQAKGLGYKAEDARHFATLYESFFQTMANASNQNVGELFRQYQLRMQQEEEYKAGDGATFLQAQYNTDQFNKITQLLPDLNGQEVRVGAHKMVAAVDGSFLAYDIRNAAGKRAGSVDVNYSPEGSVKADIFLNEKERGKGLGPKLYAAIEKQLGVQLTPNDEITAAAYGLWKKFRPEAVKNYRSIGVNPENGDEYYSRTLAQTGTERRAKVVRGDITFADDKTLIRLFKYQNPSTLIHETGHLFLKVMGDVASSEGANPKLKEDWAAIQEYLGETGPDFSVDAHEKFAKSFEAYLFDGVSPTSRLDRAFATFKAWLKTVYRKISNLGVELPDTIKDIFGRMLTADAAIDEHQRLHGLQPSFATAEEAGMTEAQFEEYKFKLGQAVEQARVDLDRKIMGDFRATQAKEIVALRKKVTEEVKSEMSEKRVYRAQDFISRGGPDGQSIKLDKAEVTKILGKGNLNIIPGHGKLWQEGKAVPFFITEKGSRYEYDKKSTKRNKAARADVGHEGDVGWKPRSERTIYVAAADAEKLGEIQAISPTPRSLGFSKDGKFLGVIYNKGPHKGKMERRTAVEFKTTPEIGLTPVEIWDKGAKHHFGNKIVSIGSDRGPVMHPDAVAAMFGYPNGAEMLKEFRDAVPFTKAVAAEVKSRMAPLVEQTLKTTPEIQQQAAVEMKNDIYRAFMAGEVRAFHRLLGVDFDEKQLKVFPGAARQIVREKTFKDVLRKNFVNQYTQSDRALNKLLGEAIKKKDWAEAAQIRLKQLFNSYLAEEAAIAHKEAREIGAYVRRFVKSSVKTLDQVYLSQIRNILIQYGFIKGQLDPTAGSFSAFLDAELEDKHPLVVDPALRARIPKPFAGMSIDEVMSIRNTIANLEFVGRNKKKITRLGKKFDLKMAVEAIVAETVKNNRAPRSREGFNPSWLDQRREQVRGFFVTSLLKVEQLTEWMDGGAVNGPAHRFIFQPMSDAQTVERGMLKDYSDRILNIIQSKPRQYYTEARIIDEIGKSMKMEEIMAVALNLGNESNYEKLKAGQSWSDEQISAIVRHMDKQDWENVQAIWNLIDSLWPNIKDTATRISMVMPDKILPRAVSNEHGDFAGGYYPIMYDPRKSAEVQRRQVASKAEEMFGIELHSIFPSAGFAKDRASSFSAPILLDFSVLPTHVSRVIHWVSHAEALENVSKIIRDKDFATTASAYFGPSIIRSLDGWLNNLSRGEVGVKGLAEWDQFFGNLRRNVTIMGLGLRATTVIMQAGGFLSGAEMIGGRHVAAGVASLFNAGSFSEIKANINTVKLKSGEMKNRLAFLERDLNDVSLALSRFGQVQKGIKDFAMAPIIVADSIVATSVWQGAYLKALDAKVGEQDAVAYADKVVRLTQGSGAPKDLSAVQRGGEFMRFMTMFYTYFSAMQNRVADIAHGLTGAEQNYQGLERPNVMVRWVYLVMLPSLMLDTVLRGVLKGTLDDKDPEELAKTAAMNMIAYQFAGVPFVRDLISYMTRSKDHFDYSYSPVVQAIERTATAWDAVVRKSADPNKSVKAKEAVQAVTYTAGYLGGLPLDALATPVYNAIKAEETGEPFSFTDLIIRR